MLCIHVKPEALREIWALKGEVGGSASNSHGNYIVDHENIMDLCFLTSVGTLIVKGLHCTSKARNSLLVDLREFFSDLGSGDEKKRTEIDQLTGHFQSSLFLNISRTNSKTSKVNQQSFLNL